jgi:hypothetical protein
MKIRPHKNFSMRVVFLSLGDKPMYAKPAFALRILIFCNFLTFWPQFAAAQNEPATLTQICTPQVTANVVVASAKQR